MSHWTRKELAGWGRYPVVDACCRRPERRSEVFDSLDQRDGQPVLAHGLGRSYGDAALLSDGKVVLTRRLDRMLDFDAETGRLRCEAGVTIGELIDIFLPRGWFPPVVPGTQYVTVGGAIGCNIHGKNHVHAGCFGDHVRRIELLCGNGEVVTCSRDENERLFWATIGGMGLTGFILSAEFELYPVESPAIEMESVRFENLDEFFDVSAAYADSPMTVSWIDCVASGDALGRGIFMSGQHADASAATGVEPSFLDRIAGVVQSAVDGRMLQSDLLLNKASIRMFNEAYFRKHPPGHQQTIVDYEPFFFPLDAVDNWNFIYGPRGFLQYQVVVPDRETIREMLLEITSCGMASFLAVIKEFGDHDHGGLSFPKPGVTLALDFPNYGDELLRLLDRLDRLVVDTGGRVYLGKDARVSRDNFRRMYPEWEQWKAVRDQWDPQQVFQSDLGRRLGLVGQ